MHFMVGFRVAALVLLSQRRAAACCVGRIRVGPHATSVRPIRQGRGISSKPLWPQWALGAGCAAPWLRYERYVAADERPDRPGGQRRPAACLLLPTAYSCSRC